MSPELSLFLHLLLSLHFFTLFTHFLLSSFKSDFGFPLSLSLLGNSLLLLSFFLQFLLLKSLFDFLNRYVLLLSDLVDLVPPLLLLLFSLLLLSELFLLDQLTKQFLGSGSTLVIIRLVLLQDLDTSLILQLLANTKCGLTRLVPLKELNLQILGQEVKHLVASVKCCNMEYCIALIILDLVVNTFVEESLDAVEVVVATGDGQHERRVLAVLPNVWHGGLRMAVLVLESFEFTSLGGHLVKEILEHLGLAGVGSGTNCVRDDNVLLLFGKGDATAVADAATVLFDGFKGLNAARLGSLDNERRTAVLFVVLDELWWVHDVDSFFDEVGHELFFTHDASHLHAVGTVLKEVDLVDDAFEHFWVSLLNEELDVAHGVATKHGRDVKVSCSLV